MDPKVSLPRLQEPATKPYSEPDEFSPRHSILFLLRSNLVLSYNLC
jgi:hypothetical protein